MANAVVVYPRKRKLINDVIMAVINEISLFSAISAVSFLVFCILRTVISPAVALYFTPSSVEITIAAAHPADIFAALKTADFEILGIDFSPLEFLKFIVTCFKYIISGNAMQWKYIAPIWETLFPEFDKAVQMKE